MKANNHENRQQRNCLLLSQSTSIDELLELASKFSIGELILNRQAKNLLFRLLKRQAMKVLRPGDELRQLNVSVKKQTDGDACVRLRRSKLGNSDCTRHLKLLLRNGSY